MTKQLDLKRYKQKIADLYTGRSQTYDNSDWHLQIAHRLVEYGQVSSGQYILDIATGTGHVAIASAQLVGAEGRVIGIDISPGMLEPLIVPYLFSRNSIQFIKIMQALFILRS